MKNYWNKEFFLKNKTLILKVTAIVLILAVAFFVFLTNGKEDEDAYLPQTDPQASEAEAEKDKAKAEDKLPIFVDISGAVNKPTVAELPAGSRVVDAINAAGGLKDSADITTINRAAFLNDGDKVLIPIKGESLPEPVSGGDGSSLSAASGGGKVNLNTATSEQLQTLNGVGPATAQKIIDYRKSNGSFRTIEGLKEVSGIGDKTFEKLKDNIII